MVQSLRRRKVSRIRNLTRRRRWVYRPQTDRLEPRCLLTAPNITEFPIPTSVVTGINSIACADDGSIWFIEPRTNAILRRETGGALSAFPVPTANSGLGTIAAARDGDLWFTETAANQIGSITPGGEITEYPIPTPKSGPVGIVQGIDGAIWFTEAAANQIGRLSTQTGSSGGGITPQSLAIHIDEYPVNTPSSGLRQIAPDFNGDLWFTESDANQLGFITADGTVTEYPLPTPRSQPEGIVFGPDHALWFTEPGADQIGRLSLPGLTGPAPASNIHVAQATAADPATDATITEYAGLLPGSRPMEIVHGFGPNLWFTEQEGNQLGRLTTDGELTEFPIPTVRSGPLGITLDHDGQPWFTESQTNQIAQSTTDGAITEQQVESTSSDPFGLTAGPDGNLWFTEFAANQVGRITPTGQVTEFGGLNSGKPLTILNFLVNPGPAVIAAGPDGNLWFTEPTAGRIGRITPAGQLTEVPVAVGGAVNSSSDPFSTFPLPAGIAAGPDGRIWFTSLLGNRVSRMDHNGSTTSFSVPTLFSFPFEIVLGPDGNLWFTETLGNAIGRLTPAGQFTEFAVPTPESEPAKLAVGPDGNLWFTEATGNKVGRITTAGIITEFVVPTAASMPAGIVAAADGNLWFTEMTGNQIGRITLDGLIAEYSLPAPDSEPFGIAGGPDGNLWFTEGLGNRIGRLELDDRALRVTTLSLAPVEGLPFSGTVATLLDHDTGTPASDYQATIHWGDGTTSAATVVAGQAGHFLINGSHTFAKSGNYALSVTVTDLDNRHDLGGFTAMARGVATVVEPPIVLGAVPVSGMEATLLSGGLALFQHGAGSDSPEEFTATIDWGDGGRSAGLVRRLGSGYEVSGSHSYKDEGTYRVEVVVQDGAAVAVGLTAATILDQALPDGSRGNANQRFVAELYQDLMNRPVSMVELARWTALLNSGATRQQVAARLMSSPEHQAIVLVQLARAYLGRAPMGGELSRWLRVVRAAGGFDPVASEMLGSPEYLAARGGGTPDGFLVALYRDLTGRMPDPDTLLRDRKLMRQGVSRRDIARAVLVSAPARVQLVNELYQRFLGRSAAGPDLAQALRLIGARWPVSGVLLQILASQEYASRL